MENRIENHFTKEDAYKSLDNVNHWIEAADNKASILFALVALFIGLTSGFFEKLPLVFNILSRPDIVLLGGVALLLILAYLYLGGYSIFFLMKVLMARLKKTDFTNIDEKNVLFFGDIAKLDGTEYINTIKRMSDDEYLNHILNQVVIISKIASVKMKNFNKALKFSLFFFLATILLIITTSFISMY
jgi:hypothetical protein